MVMGADPVGAATLERMAATFFADRERVVLTDTDRPNVAARERSLPAVPFL